MARYDDPESPGSTALQLYFLMGMQKDEGRELFLETSLQAFCAENDVIVATDLFPTHFRSVLYKDKVRWQLLGVWGNRIPAEKNLLAFNRDVLKAKPLGIILSAEPFSQAQLDRFAQLYVLCVESEELPLARLSEISLERLLMEKAKAKEITGRNFVHIRDLGLLR